MLDPKRKRVEFKEKRHVDSGVWMGSDESAAESLLPSEDASTWGEDLLKNALDSQATGITANTTSLIKGPMLVPHHRAAFKGPEESAEQRYARDVVNDCLEKGQDSIDLG